MTLQLTDVVAGRVPARLYAAESGLPVLVYLHGGGWSSGSVAGSDALARMLAEGAGCAVFSVDYRLAPEHPFPAGLEDCFEAMGWLAERGAALGVDTGRIAVGGTSAGANLATVCAALARDRGGPHLVFQLLAYPPLEHTAVADVEGAMFRRAEMRRHWSTYLRDPHDGDDPRASPLRARDLAGLPPALVITAERDPLAPEAEAYAQRLARAGVPVDVRRFAAEHGFLSSDTLQGRSARAAAAAALRAAFAD